MVAARARNRFATALEGVDLDNPGVGLDRSGHPNPVPRISGPIRRKHALEVEDLLFLKAHTKRQVKFTAPGPFTMSCQAQNDFHSSDEARDCGMKYLPRDVAVGKLQAMVQAARILRVEHGVTA